MFASSSSSSARSATCCHCCLSGLCYTPKGHPPPCFRIRYATILPPNNLCPAFGSSLCLPVPLISSLPRAYRVAGCRSPYLIASVGSFWNSFLLFLTTTRIFTSTLVSFISSPFSLFLVASLFPPLSLSLSSGRLTPERIAQSKTSTVYNIYRYRSSTACSALLSSPRPTSKTRGERTVFSFFNFPVLNTHHG